MREVIHHVRRPVEDIRRWANHIVSTSCHVMMFISRAKKTRARRIFEGHGPPSAIWNRVFWDRYKDSPMLGDNNASNDSRRVTCLECLVTLAKK